MTTPNPGVPREPHERPPTRRIPYGAERRYGRQMPAPDQPCHDCAVRPCELHQDGCDWEECETCGGQRIACDCCVVCRAAGDTWLVCGPCIERARAGGLGASPPELNAAAMQRVLDTDFLGGRIGLIHRDALLATAAVCAYLVAVARGGVSSPSEEP